MNRLVVCFLFFVFQLKAQQPNAVSADSIQPKTNIKLDLKYQQFIIPTVFIGYGIIGLESGQIKGFNAGINEEVTEHIDKKITVDDFSQYLPMASLYGLSALGVKGKNNTKDKTIILATSYLLMGLTVNAFKQTASVKRPDGTSYNSFPSGHTATAFMGAELMYQEYKDVSVWYGVSGYLVATGTGIFRMYNNRHWFTDVVAGAGIGILSAKAGYWLYPIASKWFTKKNATKIKTVMAPFHDGRNTGIGFIKTF
ncbi:phosphatase PAP2 family protein [Flavobacterium phycosphaerae]|uniref:phosphatase PAP2 family protein n=1 Tax=Flavobacterium phycosphaerae TaxID=2697515 RepID=UPI0013895FF6|nr:phosphatase PAP2 family protein [Flavobacterium phycosphaerae]